jgi:hypothetical protein
MEWMKVVAVVVAMMMMMSAMVWRIQEMKKVGATLKRMIIRVHVGNRVMVLDKEENIA